MLGPAAIDNPSRIPHSHRPRPASARICSVVAISIIPKQMASGVAPPMRVSSVIPWLRPRVSVNGISTPRAASCCRNQHRAAPQLNPINRIDKQDAAIIGGIQPSTVRCRVRQAERAGEAPPSKGLASTST